MISLFSNCYPALENHENFDMKNKEETSVFMHNYDSDEFDRKRSRNSDSEFNKCSSLRCKLNTIVLCTLIFMTISGLLGTRSTQRQNKDYLDPMIFSYMLKAIFFQPSSETATKEILWL